MEGMPDRLKQHRSKERLLDHLRHPSRLGAGKHALRRMFHHQHHRDANLGEDGLTLAVQQGSLVNSPRHSAGSRLRDTSFAIGTAFMATSSSGVFGQWAFGIGRPPHDRHGRTDILKG